MTDETLPVTDLKQWVYCRRIPFYSHVMPGSGRPTFKMREAVSAEEMFEKLEVRRRLDKYGLSRAERRFGLWLVDETLGCSGRLDLLLCGESEVAPVDFKLTSGDPGENHRMQLAGYALLAERWSGLPARRGFLYRIPDSRLFEVDIDDCLREQVRIAIQRIRRVCREQVLPEATAVRGRCVECEYQNYCGDIW